MRPLLKYLLPVALYAIILCGSVVAACIDSFDTIGYRIFWMLLPLMTLFLLMMAVNLRFAVPRLLLRNRLALYCISMLALSLLLPLAGLGMEYLMRLWMHLPQRIGNFLSPWILLDSFCNCVLIFLIMLGAGFTRLYAEQRCELHTEERLSASLADYIREVRGRLNPDLIIGRLDAITATMRVSAADAADSIRDLCAWLRRQLYELPAPQAETADDTPSPPSATAHLFISRRLRVWRHVLFQIVLAVISFGTFFNTPDTPEFTVDRLIGFLCMFLLLDIMACADIFWLFPRFQKRKDVGRYMAEVALLTATVILPLITVQALTYEPGPYNRMLPLPIIVIATAATAVTLALFLAGVSAALLMKNWLSGQRRMTLLKAEYVRQEYAFLRKQINPHFLFNVLNNAGILSEEEPEESVSMLLELRRLLLYQFDGNGRTSAPLADEIEFLRSYLSLEATRIEPFCFDIATEGDIHSVNVPTLIFITFVENAVKHSCAVDSRRSVSLLFRCCPDGLLFRCANTFSPRNETPEKTGGVGLANTARRLELLYGDGVRIQRSIEPPLYITSLKLPYDKLHNS